jgi:hypothetical protein
MTLFDEVSNLIALKTEGDYWDFKEYWHGNKTSLLHDIICMANNLVNRDAYIIIGVSDSKSPDGVKIKGVSEENRRDQQHLIDFLRNKKFSGVVRPVVYLQTLMLENDEGEIKPVDVIIIKNTNNTPYYLTENFRDRYKELRAGYIYTRIGDTNTAVDSFADVDKIEYLWRKHFGLDLTVNEKLLLLLDDPKGWEGNFNNDNYKYHKQYPEFQICISDIADQSEFQENSIMQNIAAHHLDKSFSVSEVAITYHSTVLFKEYVIYLDGYRHLIPFPKTDTISIGDRFEPTLSLTYIYLSGDTVHGKLFNCFACCDENWYNEKWDLRPGVAFLWFEDESDRQRFNQFVREHLCATDVKYKKALEANGVTYSYTTEEYYRSGWTKADEIKARHLYEQYRGISVTPLVNQLPQLRNEGSES